MIVNADISEFKTKPTIDGNDHPGLHRAKGFIGLLGHVDPVQFRNIRIKALDSGKQTEPRTAESANVQERRVYIRRFFTKRL
jgi:hypothetical protein